MHARIRVCDAATAEFIDRIRRAERLVDHEADLDDDYWVQRLRRWAHIVDKGLQWPQREQGHSSAAAAEAWRVLGRISPDRCTSDATVHWARRVLDEYAQFQEADEPGPPMLGRPVPCPVDYTSLRTVMTTRRSVRVFTDQQVTQETLDAVLGVLPWAPSSCSKQAPLAYVTTDPARTAACLETCLGGGLVGPHIPCFAAFCCDLRSYEMPGELALPWIDTALGAQNCCLAAHALGLSLTLLTWDPHTAAGDAALRRLLDIPDSTVIVVNGVMGYPAQAAPTPARKGAREAYRWVR